MKGYTTESRYMGYVNGRYVLFASIAGIGKPVPAIATNKQKEQIFGD